MSWLIDFFSFASVIGIWPRFIEPRLLKTTQLNWDLDKESAHLAGLRILHISDLHFHPRVSSHFLTRITQRVAQLKPDLILFTGDFICYSRLEESERLKDFLNTLSAPLGAYCSLGNHDYAHYVSKNPQGEYDRITPLNPLAGIFRGLKILAGKEIPSTAVTESARAIADHPHLAKLLASTPFHLLENKTVTLPIGLNITGLGDIALDRCDPATAFKGYQDPFPGMVLTHNPDSAFSLLSYPGKWILAGHTHGEQIHFPWPRWAAHISKKMARLKNRDYTRGLFQLGEKSLYVNRGLGCHNKPFRLFSPPEICLITAKKTHD